ncbi:hypothetical protein [Methanobacterium paludis]|uniref:Uncharacterized protein n=1 Tax=Methanobacterium paludis (strain DSM 25820 / JCM 18151 / SWAN1) TaxID=868131 RepID=F6D3S7_METPW|nr:hypothetical protein [Methanobacterium paludis]AEG18071.1 hypothetical protein MSWAN_1050 [Methanobacterium paludis]
MDDTGYVFTPLTLLLVVPVIILAVSYGNIINEVNNLSAFIIGGDVTVTVGNNIVKSIQDTVAGSGRNGAYNATRKVIDSYNLNNTSPFFSPGASKSYIINNKILPALNSNLTSTCRELEQQTGRNITLKSPSGQPIFINASDNSTAQIFQSGDIKIIQSDPFGFNVTVPSVPVTVTQNGQSLSFSTPTQNIYISLLQLEDPYVWVNTKARTSSLIYQYPYYNPNTNNYYFDVNASSGRLDYLWECLDGQNSSELGSRPYYFPDPNGLSFFDRLEGGAVNASESNASRMSTFIIGDPLQEDHKNIPTSCLDHEYFQAVSGSSITTTNNADPEDISFVMDPTGKIFYLSQTYMNFFKLASNYNYG